MRCQNCGIENAARSRGFATEVARRLTSCVRSAARRTLPRLYSDQNAGLQSMLPGGHARPKPLGSSLTGERRHLTVLFCDLVSSTSLAARLDPQDRREIVAGYHHAAAQLLARQGRHHEAHTMLAEIYD